MRRALHDGPAARELDISAKAGRRIEIRAADQEKAELGLAEFLVEFGVAASRDIKGKDVLRLLDDGQLERVVAGVGPERRRDALPRSGSFFARQNASP